MTSPSGPLTAAVALVRDALTDHGLVVVDDPGTYPPVGPCVVVGLPIVTAQDGVCDRWTVDVPLRVLATSNAARQQLLTLADTTLAALAAAHLSAATGGLQMLDVGVDGQVLAYELTVTID